MGKFENDIAINEVNLVEELMRQPQKFYEWARQAVNASIDSTTAKDKLEVVKAEIEIRIRKNPSLYDLPDKPTEAMVKASVICNRKVRKSTKEYLEALRIERLLSKAERAFEHRKKSLEGLVHINQQFYFADPKTNSRTRQMVDETLLLQSAREKRKIKRRRNG